MPNLSRKDWLLLGVIAAVIVMLLLIIYSALTGGKQAGGTGSTTSSAQTLFLPDDIKLPDHMLVSNSTTTTTEDGKPSTFTGGTVQDKELTLQELADFYKSTLASESWTVDSTYLDTSVGQFLASKGERKAEVWFKLQAESIALEIAASPK